MKSGGLRREKAYDLIVIGAGPAGSTAATLVKKYNPAARVLILEKSVFPRHHVGESLLTGSIPVLKEMGVFEKINAAKFVRKIGAVYVWGEDRKPWNADFADLNDALVRQFGESFADGEFPWQVLRSRYDEILLRHAESLGVEARMGWRAVEPLRNGKSVVGTAAQGPDGRRVELRSRMLMDCSGQNSFLSEIRKTRDFREDLKNIAFYGYFEGAKWKFELTGHPDKSKIFICSVPEGWFWYIPLSRTRISVGLVMKSEFAKKAKIPDPRAYYLAAARRCAEIAPLLEGARLEAGVDPHAPEKDFFTAGDWSFASKVACGPGWMTAGDASFFLDPLLSSGVMMAHLSGHRAAYTINTMMRESDPAFRREMQKDYNRFCAEIADTYLALIRYWYRNDPNARGWWHEARAELQKVSPLEIDEKMSFVAISAGCPYYFERAYTVQDFISRADEMNEGEKNDLIEQDLKHWKKAGNFGVLEPPFLESKSKAAPDAGGPRAPDPAAIPKLTAPHAVSLTFLPYQGGFRPIHRVDWSPAASKAPGPKRVVPRIFLEILSLIDGRRSVQSIRESLSMSSELPCDIIDRQVSNMISDLAGVGVMTLSDGPAPGGAAPARGRRGWGAFRRGEWALRAGRTGEALALLNEAVAAEAGGAWACALRGEAHRQSGGLEEALKDFDRAAAFPARSPRKKAGRLSELGECYEAEMERSWYEARIFIYRAKALTDGGDAAGAFLAADRAVGCDPRHSEALVLRAKISLTLGRRAEALADLKMAEEILSRRKKVPA